jgi:GNAT superfamily N-acetyltransferase
MGGIKSRSRKRRQASKRDERREVPNRLETPVVIVREPGPRKRKSDLFSETLRMSKLARKEVRQFIHFDAKPRIVDVPQNENNHAILASISKGQYQGYLTYCDHDNINWPWGGDRQPKMIDEFMRAWYDIEWSGKYQIEYDKIAGMKWCVLNQIWVQREFRQSGLGEILIGRFLEYCHSNNRLPIVDLPNQNFHNFTKRIGLLEGEHWFHFKTNLVIPKRYLWEGADRGLGPKKSFLNSNAKAVEYQKNDGKARLPDGSLPLSPGM